MIMNMDKEDRLASQIEQIRRLGTDNPNLDTNAMIGRLLAQSHASSLSASIKTRAYLVSIFLPPFGMYYAVKFLLRDETDARRSAWICLVLTAACLLILWLMMKMLLASAPDLQELQNLRLQDINELRQ